MRSFRRVLAVTARVLGQVLGDHRSVALMMVVPSLLTGLFAWTFNDSHRFEKVGPLLVGLFPFTVMFLLTSITSLRERRSGTLERFLTTPMRKYEFVFGYALAFGFMATFQATITLAFATYVCNLPLNGAGMLILGASVANALLGMSLGLMSSAFAKTEFQVVQFMPALIFPQIVLGGLFVPIEQMPAVLQSISSWLPLTHALRSLDYVARQAPRVDIYAEIGLVIFVSALALMLGAFTLRKKTP